MRHVIEFAGWLQEDPDRLVAVVLCLIGFALLFGL